MKILIRISLGLLLFIAAVAIIGFFLPKTYHVERTVVINAPAEKIFPEVSDLRSWDDWSPWKESDPTIKTTYAEKTSGIGGKMTWKSDKDPGGSLEITEVQPNEMVGYDLYFEGYPKTTGYITLEEENNATTVKWVMDGSMGTNPFSRYFGLMIDSMVGKDFEKGLNKLKMICTKS